MPSSDQWFNDALQAFREGRMPAGKLFDLGAGPNLNLPDWPPAPMLMNQSVMRKAADKHGLDILAFLNLPSRIASPVMVFDSRTHPGAFVIVTDLVIEGKPAVLAVHKTHTRNLGSFNDVRSIHLRDPYQIAIWVKQGLMRYQAKKQPSDPCKTQPPAIGGSMQ